MNSVVNKAVVIAILSYLLTGCAISPAVPFTGGQQRLVNEMISVQDGIVIESRKVSPDEIEGNRFNKVVGAAVGLVTGAVIGNDGAAQVMLGLIGGFVGSKAVDAYAQSKATQEYVVLLETGDHVLITQATPDDVALLAGDTVRVLRSADGVTKVIAR